MMSDEPLRRFVVYGPPDSGKTRWVHQHARVGELVWDFDCVAAALTGGVTNVRHLELPTPIVALGRALHSTLVAFLSEPPFRSIPAFIIVTGKARAEEIAQRIGADTIRCPAPFTSEK